MNDAAYYAHREQTERVLAEAAAEPSVRNIHLKLAAKYAELHERALNEQKLAPPDSRGTAWPGRADARSQ